MNNNLAKIVIASMISISSSCAYLSEPVKVRELNTKGACFSKAKNKSDATKLFRFECLDGESAYPVTSICYGTPLNYCIAYIDSKKK